MSRPRWSLRARSETLAEALGAVATPWVLARILVMGALALTRHVASELDVTPRPMQLSGGLLSWDASWYADIARGGYDAVAHSGFRFFPLVPLLGRLLALAPGVDADLGVLVVSNMSALAFAVLLHRLVVLETGDRELARRSVWIGALAPPAFVLVMGYAEATVMACAVAAFLALRTKRWGWAACAGFAAGLARPVGVLLVVPALIEAARDLRRAQPAERVARGFAVAGPALGIFSYLVWVWDRTGDVFLAIRLHNTADLRGGTVEPVGNLLDALRDLAGGDRFGSGLHFLSALVLGALAVVLVQRWPAPYAAYAIVSLLLGVTADNLDSLERYSLSTFPFVLAAAGLVERPGVERSVLTISAAGLVGASVLAFTGVFVP